MYNKTSDEKKRDYIQKFNPEHQLLLSSGLVWLNLFLIFKSQVYLFFRFLSQIEICIDLGLLVYCGY